jgi:uncharacterized tellurite resistance protein B-like protein
MTPTQRVEILRACCCVAGADGKTTAEELKHIKRLADSVGVGEASLNAMIARAERDSGFYRQQFNVLKADPLQCLDVLLKVATANGMVKESELEVLKGLAGQLDIGEQDFRSRVAAVLEEGSAS